MMRLLWARVADSSLKMKASCGDFLSRGPIEIAMMTQVELEE
jgi:hypothetical protein